MEPILFKLPPTICNASEAIAKAIAQAPDSSTLRLAPDTYQLEAPINVDGKTSLVIDATDCIFSCHFDRINPLNSSEAFHFNHCSNIRFTGARITTDVPAQIIAKVESASSSEAVFELFPKIPLTGHEKYCSGLIFDDERKFSLCSIWPKTYDQSLRVKIGGEIITTSPFTDAGLQYCWLGNNRIRVTDATSLECLKPGMSCSFVHSRYQMSDFVFRNCSDVIIENVTIDSCGGMAFVILPRCRNFTFRNIAIVRTDDAFTSIAADGIHTTGLGGFLHLENCTFDYLRDDPLNLHTQLVTVMNTANGKYRIAYDKLFGNISPDWGRKGDLLNIYDPKTCAKKGTAVINEFIPTTDSDGKKTAELILAPGCLVNVGDLIANDAYFADLVIERCHVHSYRRSYVIQSARSAHITGCDFDGSNMAVYISANYGKYLEGGPTSNAIVENNTFRNTRGGNVVILRAGGPGTLGPGNHHNVGA